MKRGKNGENCYLFRQDVVGRAPFSSEQTCNKIASGVAVVYPRYQGHKKEEEMPEGIRRCR